MRGAVFILFLLAARAFELQWTRRNVHLNMMAKSDSGLPSTDRAGFYSKLEDVAKGVGVAATVSGVATFTGAGLASAKDVKRWTKVDVPLRETLFDISFDKDKPEHGWIVGAKGTFLETFDGGVSWKPRTFNSLDEDEDINYRFEVTSLNQDEGWIVVKLPVIMLHTRDGGKQFERIPMSPKLPGEPVSIKATSPSKAEMITSQGAIYTTENGGLNWKAMVKETIDATLIESVAAVQVARRFSPVKSSTRSVM